MCDTPIARINHIRRGMLYAWCYVQAIVRVVEKEGALEGGGVMNESYVMDG